MWSFTANAISCSPWSDRLGWFVFERNVCQIRKCESPWVWESFSYIKSVSWRKGARSAVTHTAQVSLLESTAVFGTQQRRRLYARHEYGHRTPWDTLRSDTIHFRDFAKGVLDGTGFVNAPCFALLSALSAWRQHGETASALNLAVKRALPGRPPRVWAVFWELPCYTVMMQTCWTGGKRSTESLLWLPGTVSVSCSCSHSTWYVPLH